MKKFGIILLVIIGIASVCTITCPDTQTHKESLIPMVTNVWNQQNSDKADARIKEIDKEHEEFMKKPFTQTEIETGIAMNENRGGSFNAEKELIEMLRSIPVGYYTVESFLDNNLVVTNYFLFSIGKIRIDKGYENISLGCFGHVFAISEEEFRIIFDVIHK